MSVPNFSTEMFGVSDFQWMTLSGGGWQVFHNRPPQFSANPDSTVKLYHGTTLNQCRTILNEGFRVGLHFKGSESSPTGIWGCSAPGHCIDRVPLSRGYSFNTKNVLDRDVLCGWDCPVVLAWIVEKAGVGLHKVLADGTEVWVYKLLCGSIWDVPPPSNNSDRVADAVRIGDRR